MAAKKPSQPEPAVRKSFLVVGGIALACALIGFVLMNFVAGGGGGEAAEDDTAVLSTTTVPAAPSTPVPESEGDIVGVETNVLVPGGRDPFSATGGSAPAPATTVPTPSATPYVPPAPVAPAAPAVAPQPAPQQAQPQPQPVQNTGPATINVIRVYAGSADIKINSTVFEGARPVTQLDTRFSLEQVDSSCAYINDAGTNEQLKVCGGETMSR